MVMLGLIHCVTSGLQLLHRFIIQIRFLSINGTHWFIGGDTINFDFIMNDYDFYPNGSRQDLLFEISGGQFYDYQNNQLCDNPPCDFYTNRD